eukprot:9485599-Pyramimonas_sp.AAC.1
MDMICCSPYATSMTHVSLETEFWTWGEKTSKETLFDSFAGFNDWQVAARGNASSMLPHHGILREFRQLDKEGRQGGESAAPRVGEKLGSVA